MRILEQRFLRGPNLHADTPCLLSVLDLGSLYGVSSKDIPGFADALLALMPTLEGYTLPTGQLGGFGQRLREGTYMARIVEQVTLDLQCQAGAPASYGRTRPVTGHSGQFRVVCAYALENVVAPAFRIAVELVVALSRNETFDLAARLAQLRATALQFAVDPSTAAILSAAHERGIPTQRLSEEANLFQLGWGSKQQRLQDTLTGAASHVAVQIAGDRRLSMALLREAGIPVPPGEAATTRESALGAARRLGLPVTIKPLRASPSDVAIECATLAEVEAAFLPDGIIVEQSVAGKSFRVLVAGGRIAAAAWRRPAQVTGDGVHSIRDLVARENRNPLRSADHVNILSALRLDAHADAVLARQGFTVDSIAPSGQPVRLRARANLATGGTVEDVTDRLPSSTRRLCVRTAATIGLDVVGIDIVCADIGLPLKGQGGAIVAVTAMPDVRMHEHPTVGMARDAGDAIVDSLLGDSDGRIPLIAVTGTNGKTTTALIVAHCAAMAGLLTGVTTTEGVFIDGERVATGDCTGYWSARTVLADSEVELAVLETARGGILKRGLAFDRCDVGIVLNVTADHLGLDGVDTLEDLAQVKAVVASSASHAVVLNAEDRLCVAMGRRVRPGVEIVYFSMEADNPVLLQHLDRSGRAVYLQDNAVIIADGTRRHELLRVEAMPCALNGIARYNIANAIAAAAGLMAAGFDQHQIADGLSTFVSDGKTNPLRANVFDVRGVTVIVDYAHNAAAYMALAEMARAMLPGQLIGVVTAPGDRRDAELLDIGRTCGARFDELVVYEAEQRVRAPGATADLILAGARTQAGLSDTLHRELDAAAAVRLGLALCAPGDVLVFACGTTLQVLVDAVRATDPEVADRIAGEIET
ncbi:cyanophycin synthetase [Massilia sp. S19_KUP03_FR1]|uniref:cyanophycin synthetase n=1 Tax=Massilia sp. S19_KUP03_FR1 TaxID=3025503 RepID=UPI002FCDD47A